MQRKNWRKLPAMLVREAFEDEFDRLSREVQELADEGQYEHVRIVLDGQGKAPMAIFD